MVVGLSCLSLGKRENQLQRNRPSPSSACPAPSPFVMHSLLVKRGRRKGPEAPRKKEGRKAAAHSFGFGRRGREKEERKSLCFGAYFGCRCRTRRMGPSLVHSPLEIRSRSHFGSVRRVGGAEHGERKWNGKADSEGGRVYRHRHCLKGVPARSKDFGIVDL